MKPGSKHTAAAKRRQSAGQRKAHARRRAAKVNAHREAISAGMRAHHARRRAEGKSSGKAIAAGIAAKKKIDRRRELTIPVAKFHAAEFERLRSAGVDMQMLDGAVERLHKRAVAECAHLAADRREDGINRTHRRYVRAWLAVNKPQLAKTIFGQKVEELPFVEHKVEELESWKSVI